MQHAPGNHPEQLHAPSHLNVSSSPVRHCDRDTESLGPTRDIGWQGFNSGRWGGGGVYGCM